MELLKAVDKSPPATIMNNQLSVSSITNFHNEIILIEIKHNVIWSKQQNSTEILGKKSLHRAQ